MSKPLLRSEVKARVKQVIGALKVENQALAIDLMAKLMVDLEMRGIYDLQARRFDEQGE